MYSERMGAAYTHRRVCGGTNMTDLLPPWPLFSAFLVASTALAVTPGPGVLYIVTRTLAQGRRSGLISVAGVALGNLSNVLAASIGLAALFAVSSLAFSILKYAGALYLVYLGLQMLRRPSFMGQSVSPPPMLEPRVFRDGFVVALLNPKTTMFFAAFLPQFVSVGASPMVQSALLGSIFVAIAAITDALYVVAAGVLVRAVSERSRFGRGARVVGGLSFVGLGVFAALSKSGVER